MSRKQEEFVRRLTGEEGQRLVRAAHTGPHRITQRRAMILLASAQGRSAQDIAAMIDGSVDYVGEVIHAFNEHGFRTLDWSQNGVAGGLSKTTDDTIAGTIAATPWPTPVTWASRSRASRRTIAPPRRLPKPSPFAAHPGDQLPVREDAAGLARSRLPGQEQPDARLRHAPGDERALRGDDLGPLVLQSPSEGSGARGTGQPDSGPPTPSEPLGLTSDERHRLSELERENARLRQECELLKAAAALFAAESRSALSRP